MYEKLESGEPKIDAARTVLTDFISELPDEELNVGLRVYGATTGAMGSGACEDSQLSVVMQGVDKDALLGIVSTTNPKGATPIAYSLDQAGADFQGLPSEARKVIVLVTDGEESCGGDLKAALETYRAQGIEIDLRIIGLGLEEKAAQSFEGVGTFQNALTADEFSTALETATNVEPALPTYSFDANDEGWLVYGHAQGNQDQEDISKPNFFETGSSPGGMLCADDSAKGDYWYWLSPLSGDQTALYGTGVSFDLRQNQPPLAVNNDVVLEGNGLTLVFQIDSPPSDEWRTYHLGFTELGWINEATGKAATKRNLQVPWLTLINSASEGNTPKKKTRAA
jgi:hypothetical protein